jgi:hypothetical protein
LPRRSCPREADLLLIRRNSPLGLNAGKPMIDRKQSSPSPCSRRHSLLCRRSLPTTRH